MTLKKSSFRSLNRNIRTENKDEYIDLIDAERNVQKMVPIYSDYVDGGLNLNQNRQLDDDDIENEKKTIKSSNDSGQFNWKIFACKFDNLCNVLI